MQDKSIHIISFDNPFPPVYGGVIDVFYKVKALHKLGYQIYLHCFVSKVPDDYPELKAVTAQVYFYKTSVNPLLFFSWLPYSVVSRNHSELLVNLQVNDAPILFENLKTTFLMHEKALRNHKTILRLQNIEHDYFLGLSKSEQSYSRKISFYFEALKYKRFEKVIKKFNNVLAISSFEHNYISTKFGNSTYVPVFHGNEKVVRLDGFGKYALYHGDLNTADNREVVRFLVSVFKEIPDYTLLISAGVKGSFVTDLIKDSSNIEFVLLKDFKHLQQLLNEAHINISWSFQKSGTKLKLINALFNGRFSIINENIVDDPAVAGLCHLVGNKAELTAKINELKDRSYDEYSNRMQILESHLSDVNNALLIDKLISRKK